MPKKINKTSASRKTAGKLRIDAGFGILNEITADTKLAQILEFPLAEEILRKYNLPCLSCPMAKFEIQSLTIGQASGAYGLDLDNMLKDLNGALKVYTKQQP